MAEVKSTRHRLAAFCVCLMLAGTGAAAAEDDDQAIDLRLFGTAELDGFDGCRLALWQEDRDPAQDKFAYVLFQPFGGDGTPLPAWMKIAKEMIELEPVATGENIVGRGLASLQVFKSSADGTLAVVDVLDAGESADGTAIADARITVVQTGKLPFRIRVKGEAGCPAATAQAGTQPGGADDAIRLTHIRDFDSLSSVPPAILETVRRDLGDLCDPEGTPGMGAVYAISGAMSLWQIPCMLAAYQGSSVFVAALNDTPSHNVLLPFSLPPGYGDARFDIMSPQVSPSGTVTSVAFGRGAGDCGVYERHQLVEEEGEAVAFRLETYREKPDCDGEATEPERFPLVYGE